MIGTTVSHYRILEKLGEGGMGVVYKAKDLRLERAVALKLVSKKTTNTRFRTGLLREAKLAASLNHSNIAHVYEAGEVEGEWYIAMEFVEGQTLRQKMKSQAPLPELAGYLLQVASALQHAHSRGVVHCDLKPENIIVTADGSAKVLDFGLARLIRASRREETQQLNAEADTQSMSSLWSSEFIEGTLGYMSPEQAEGKDPVTASTDIFSFGCILFEAVAHRVPFSDPSPIRALHKLLYDPPPNIQALTPSGPKQLQRVLDACLAKDPGNRANSLVEVSEELRIFLQSALEEHRTPRVGRSRRLWFPLAGHRRVYTLVTVFVALVLCVVGVLYFRTPPSLRQKVVAGEIKSLAVLPFTNASRRREINVLSDGLSEGLINDVAQLPNLKVVARTSSFQFKGDGRDTRHIAQTLGVQALLAGRLDESNGQLRVDVELINGEDGEVLWEHQYRPNTKDLTTVEEQIVREIAGRIHGPLKQPGLEPRLSESSGVAPEAYSLFLRGRYEMRLYNPESTQKAVDYYREALAVDPGFALADAELANSYRLLSGAGILAPAQAMPLAEAAALRAIGKDKRLAQAHAVLADIRRDQWNWQEAEQEYARALNLNPNLVSARTGFAIYLSLVGKFDQAISQALKARDLDPIGVPTSINVGAVYYNCRKYDAALRELKRSIGLDPSASALWTWTGIVYGGSGDYAQAISAYEKAFQLGDRTAATRCNYGYALARAGRRKEAQRILAQLQASKEYLPPTALAILYVGLGQDGRALQMLEQAFSSRDQLVQYIGVESHFDSLHTNPRFQRLIEKLGLPVSPKESVP